MSISDKHYHPIIASRLHAIADGKQWFLLTDYLSELSHAHFRTACYILCEGILPPLSCEEFWQVVILLYKYNAKAFLVTCMKAALGRVEEFNSEPANAFWTLVSEHDIDTSKTLHMLLPVITDNHILVRHLLDSTIKGNPEKRIAVLLQENTPASAFILFQSMRQVEHQRSLLIRTTHFLMKRGDSLSFNLASLFKAYFGLDEVKGTFSLRLQPFELARLETSFEAFKKRIISSF